MFGKISAKFINKKIHVFFPPIRNYTILGPQQHTAKHISTFAKQSLKKIEIYIDQS